MNALEHFRETLPVWVVWARLVLSPLQVAFWILFASRVFQWASRPRPEPAPELPWTEKARAWFAMQQVTRIAALLSAAGVLAALHLEPSLSSGVPFWLLTPLYGLAYVYAADRAALPLRRLLAPAWKPPAMTRTQSWALLLALYVATLSPLALGSVLPANCSLVALLLAGVWLLFSFWLLFGGAHWFGAVLGAYAPLPEQHASALEEAAQAVGVRPVFCAVLPHYVANAYATRGVSGVLVTDTMLKVLDHQEVSAILRHEFGHLRESRWSLLAVSLPAMLLQFVFLFHNPLYARFGSVPVLVAAYVLFWGVFFLVRRLARRHEERADHVAKHSVDEDGTYARALEKMYEHNLMPAVLGKSTAAHPDLYDRMVSAGVTPAYAKPEKPLPVRKLRVFGGLLALLVAYLAWGAGLEFLSARTPFVHVSLALSSGDASAVRRYANGLWRLGERPRAVEVMAAQSRHTRNPNDLLDLVERAVSSGDCDGANLALRAVRRAGVPFNPQWNRYVDSRCPTSVGDEAGAREGSSVGGGDAR